MKTSFEIRDFLTAQQENLANEMVERQWTPNPLLDTKYGLGDNDKTLEDARYHLRYLSEAVGAEAPALFTDYVAWLEVTLTSRNIPVKNLSGNLEIMRDVLRDRMPAETYSIVGEFIEAGLRKVPPAPAFMPSFISDSQPLADLARDYMRALLRYDRSAASDLIMQAVQGGVSVRDIYKFVFEPCQYEIGRLWQSNAVSIPEEHYCTASTQLIMAQLYPYIFRVEKVSSTKVVAACASGELHEMGARMLCDLLEMEGWSTIYLGANVPSAGVVKALRDSESTVLAISASMTFHIPAVREMITAVRMAGLGTKIIVGGYLFKAAPSLWSDLGADRWTQDVAGVVEFLRREDDGVEGC